MTNVVNVDTDQYGQIKEENLEAKIQGLIKENKKPFYICALAGTTVMGGYDNIEEICKICKKYNIWVHVDGCWGMGAILTKKYKHLSERCLGCGQCELEPT
eukprot:UN29045